MINMIMISLIGLT